MRIIDCYNILLQAELVKAAKMFDEGRAEVTDLEYNSKNSSAGNLFFCKGEKFKIEYLIEAVEKGAVCYVAENLIKGGSSHKPSVILVKDIRKAMAVLSKAVYFPDDTKMKIIGVTGTKGKSTTVYMLKTIFEDHLKDKYAYVSGIEIDDGTGLKNATLTTPETIDLFKHMDKAVKAHKEVMIMEISSQALKYGRCECIEFDISGFLNISNDHISPIEHPDFNDYLDSKIKIFDSSKSTWINSESEHFNEILSYAKDKCKVKTYGNDEKDNMRILKIDETPEEMIIKAELDGSIIDLTLSMGGVFNVGNALCAASIAYDYGIPIEVISEALKKVFVPGRMEIFNSINGRVVAIIDYAHNGVSFEKIFSHIKKNYHNRKIAVTFGCVGGKAYNRRKETGEVSSKFAECVYIVPNNPAEEDYKMIGKEIVGYMQPGPKVVEIMDSREAGIKEAFKCANSSEDDWVVLVLGKSREQYQNYGVKKVKCRTNYEVVKEEILKV